MPCSAVNVSNACLVKTPTLVDTIWSTETGWGEDFVRRFRLFAVPRNLGHHAKETSGTLGGIEQGQFLENFAIEGKLLQLCKGEVT